MTIDRTVMQELREYLQRQWDQRSWTLLRAEAETGVSKGTIDNILKGKGNISLETAYKLAEFFGLPRWRVLEMAGFPPGVPMDDAGLSLRLASLKKQAPELSEVLDRLASYDRQDIQAVLSYMEHMESVRKRQPK